MESLTNLRSQRTETYQKPSEVKTSGTHHSSFTSSIDGKERTVTILSTSQCLKNDQVDIVRNAFKKQFGEGVTQEAFRLIEQRLKDKDSITGADVGNAKLTALELISPGLRFASTLLKAQKNVTKFTHELQVAEGKLVKAERNLKEANKDWENSGINSGLSLLPGYQKPIETAKDDIESAQVDIANAKKKLEKLKGELEKATTNLKLFNRALDEPLLAKQDELTLKKQADELELTVSNQKKEISSLKDQIVLLQHDVEKRQITLSDYSSGGLRSINAPGLSHELESADEKLLQAQGNLKKAEKSLLHSKKLLAETNEKITALTTGPHFRRAQQLLNNVGRDERFLRILEDLSPGKGVGGLHEALEKKLQLPKMGELIGNLAAKVLPPIGIAKIFWNAIKAEDCERFLGVAKEHMGNFPLAKGIAESLAHSKETEKWKLGLQGTLSFVSTVLTTPLPGSHSLMSTLKPQNLHRHHTFDQEVRAQLLESSKSELESLPENFKEKLEDDIQEILQDGIVESQMDDLEAKELRHTLKKLAVKDGTAVPVIPVKSYGDGNEITRDLSLADPEVSIALLTYLGPPEDTKALQSTNSNLRENEERRVHLRQEMFGAKPNEDLTPGKSKDVDTEKKIIKELNSKNTREESFVTVKTVSPLHLLCTGSGLILN